LALDGRIEPGHDDERPSHDTEKGRKLRALRIYAVALEYRYELQSAEVVARDMSFGLRDFPMSG